VWERVHAPLHPWGGSCPRWQLSGWVLSGYRNNHTVWCGRLGIDLRGHHDDRDLCGNEAMSDQEGISELFLLFE